MKLKNAHRTAWREVLYRFHPWFGRDVCVHAIIERAGIVVFRCTLDGSDAARWLEIPDWMFDRGLCPHEPCLTSTPFAGVEALKALSALLDQALKTAVPSSNALLSDAFGISHDQNRGESHDSQGDNAGDQASASPAKRVQQMDLFRAGVADGAPAWKELPEDARDALISLMSQLLLKHARTNPARSEAESVHDC
jgi:hypothetical protein